MRKPTIGFVMSVRPSVRMELGSHWTDFHESWYLSSLRNCRKKSNFVKIWREWVTLHEDRCTFMTSSRLILLRMWNVPDKSCSKYQNTHFTLSKFFVFQKSCRWWDNVEKYCTPGQATDDNIIWRMRFAFWLTKAKDIHSEYVILIAFPLQQRLRERGSMYFISSCLTTILGRYISYFVKEGEGTNLISRSCSFLFYLTNLLHFRALYWMRKQN